MLWYAEQQGCILFRLKWMSNGSPYYARLKWISSQAALDFCIAAAIFLLIMETSGEWVAIIVILRTFTGKNPGCSLAN